MINIVQCDQCVFWEAEGGNSPLGECRRHAPVPKYSNYPATMSQQAIWPITENDEFCGEGKSDTRIGRDAN